MNPCMKFDLWLESKYVLISAILAISRFHHVGGQGWGLGVYCGDIYMGKEAVAF